VIALGLYLCMSLVLVVSHGHYAAGPVTMMLAVGLVLLASGRERLEHRRLDPSLLLAGSLVGLAILTAGNQMIYARDPESLKWVRAMLIVTTFAIVGAVIASRAAGRVAALAAPIFAGLALLAMFVGKAFVLHASPQPFIDVWTSSVAAVDHILAGRNPYTQQYVDIYGGAYNYKPGMPYGPSFLLWSTLWAKLFGGQHDVRVGLVISEYLVALGLGWLCFRRSKNLVAALALALLWTTNPIGLFVLEQSWIDPLLMAALVAALIAHQERWLATAGVALGFAFAVKTYAMVAVGLIALWVIRGEGFTGEGLKATRRFVIGAVAGCAAFVGPFLVLDAGAFWNSMFGLWADQAPRADALTLVALRGEIEGVLGQGHEALRPLYGPFTVLTLGLAATSGWWVWKRAGTSFGRLGWGLATVHVWFFLFARQAFCNYYYYALVFLFLVLAGSTPRPAGSEART